jgi:hypothetical protein
MWIYKCIIIVHLFSWTIWESAILTHCSSLWIATSWTIRWRRRWIIAWHCIAREEERVGQSETLTDYPILIGWYNDLGPVHEWTIKAAAGWHLSLRMTHNWRSTHMQPIWNGLFVFLLVQISVQIWKKKNAALNSIFEFILNFSLVF